MNFLLGTVYIHLSLWSLVLVVGFSLDAYLYIKKYTIDLNPRKLHLIIAGIIAMVITILSVILHEAGHAVASAWYGIPITRAGINGLYAYVIPSVDFANAPISYEIIVPLMGPLTNYAIAVIAAIIVKIYGESVFENTVQYVAYINIRLGHLNLLPLFVLDGGRASHGILRYFIDNPLWLLVMQSLVASIALTYVLVLRKKIALPKLEDYVTTL